MALFSKAEYLEVVLPFICEDSSEDADVCMIGIEAYGRILDDYKYYYASFEVHADHYDALLKLLTTTDEKQLKVIAKVKNGSVKNFKIDLNDLAVRLNDKRLEKIVLSCWGINDNSFKKPN